MSKLSELRKIPVPNYELTSGEWIMLEKPDYVGALGLYKKRLNLGLSEAHAMFKAYIKHGAK